MNSKKIISIILSSSIILGHMHPVYATQIADTLVNGADSNTQTAKGDLSQNNSANNVDNSSQNTTVNSGTSNDKVIDTNNSVSNSQDANTTDSGNTQTGVTDGTSNDKNTAVIDTSNTQTSNTTDINNSINITPDTNSSVSDSVQSNNQSYTVDKDMENYLKQYLIDSKTQTVVNSQVPAIASLPVPKAVSNSSLSSGTYTIQTEALKAASDDKSMLNSYLDPESTLQVNSDGSKSIILTFSSNAWRMSDYTIQINGQDIKFDVLENTNDVLKLKFKIDSENDPVTFGTKVNTGFFNMSTEARILFDSSTLVKISDKVDGILTDGTYDIETKALKINSDTDSALKSYLNSQSTLQVKNGKKSIILNFDSDAWRMSNNTIKINGQDVSYKVLESTNDTLKLKFDIDSEDDVVVFGTTINTGIFNMATEARILFDSNNMTKTSDTVADDPANNTTIKLDNGTYTVNNKTLKIGSDDESSIRSYLKEASKLEVTNDKKSVTLTFDSNVSLMSDYAISINNNDITYKVVESTNDILKLKFDIDDIDDTIVFATKVNTPMGQMSVQARILLDSSSLVKVSDTVDSSDNNAGGNGSTGGSDSNTGSDNSGGSSDGNNGDQSNGSGDSSTTLKDGNYTIENSILQGDNDAESMARSFIEKKTDLKAANGVKTIKVHINSIDSMDKIEVNVDGTAVKSNVVKNGDGTGYVEVDINSISSKIAVSCNIIPAGNAAVKFRVVLDKSTLKDTSGNQVDSGEQTVLDLSKNATYKIQNEALKIDNDDLALSANYLNKESIIEVIDGKIYLTLKFTSKDLMNGRYVKVNGNATRCDIVNNTDDNLHIRFEISSLSDEIVISDKVTNSSDEGFRVKLNNSTLLEYIESSGSAGNGNSNNSSSTDEDEDDDEDDDDDDDLDNGTYTIKNKTLKENSNSESMARDYLDTESILTVKSSKKYLTLKFTKGSLMSGVTVKVDGKKVSYDVVKDSGDKYHIKFKIGSLDDEILVSSNINTGSSIGSLSVKFRVLLRESTLEEIDDDDEEDDDEDIEEVVETTTEEGLTLENAVVPNQEQQVVQNNVPALNASNASEYKKLTYKVNNEILTDSAIGYQAARSAVNQTSYYEVEEGNHYVTLGFGQTDVMNNIRIAINGQQVSYETISENSANNTKEIRFKIPSISTNVTVTANISAMGRDISFGVQFLESTLELISTEENEKLPDLTSGVSAVSSGGVSGFSASGSSASSYGAGNGDAASYGSVTAEATAVDEETIEEAKEYFKKYTVSNEVVSDSAIGRTMARKYLNQTSIIEEIDGKFYATITFSSAGSMGDFKVEVNGQQVSHSVPLNDQANELVSLRFPISSVNDDIRVYIFIKPVKMNINFGVKFLEDTMILIEEGTVGEDGAKAATLADTLANENSKNNNNNDNNSAVKIAVSTSAVTIILGQIISIAGDILRRKFTKA